MKNELLLHEKKKQNKTTKPKQAEQCAPNKPDFT